MKRNKILSCAQALLAATTPVGATAPKQAAENIPDILVMMGDDIGWNNSSIYHRGDVYAEHWSHRKGRRDVYLLVWPAKLYRWPRGVHSLASARSDPSANPLAVLAPRR